MEPLQGKFEINPGSSEPPEAKITGFIGTRDGKRGLELLVNIEGKDRTCVLRLDALEGHGLSGPAAVEELRALREELEELRTPIGQLAGSAATLANEISRSRNQ